MTQTGIRIRVRICSCAILVLSTLAWSESSRFGCSPPAPDSTITTDRPAFTNASTAVPCLSLQFENGFLETPFLGQRSLDLPETLLRFGLTNTTEFRVTAPDYYQNGYSGTGFSTGLGDTSIGLKQQLGPLHGLDLSLISYVGLPTGARKISSHGYDPAVQAPWSRKLSQNWTTAGMLSTVWPTQNHRRNVTGQASLLFDRQLTTAWDAFVEYSGTFPQRGAPQHILHFGTAYKLTAHQQLDLRGGVGFASYPGDSILGVGYSFRFDLKGSRAPSP